MTDMLSHQIIGGLDPKICSSHKSCPNQDNSTAVIASERYSASVELRETVDCFLVAQEIGFAPKTIRNAEVERLSIESPAQSELE